MEDNFTLAWEDTATMVQGEEEVICSIENDILQEGDGTEVATSSEEVPEEVEEQVVEETTTTVPSSDNIIYINEENVLVMQPQETEEQFLQVSETEVVADQWDESCPQEIVVGSEEVAGGSEEQTGEDLDIPLPTDQDEYTASRPYPCDFCSRRFRKKANLMNHMVAHQTDRPHGCNLCGVRYIRKCDLMNHLKVHAYIPETDGLDEEDIQHLDESDVEKRGKRKGASSGKKRKTKIKEEYDYEGVASSSRSYNYVDEDMRLMEAMENNGDYQDYTPASGHHHDMSSGEIRYPVTDARKPFVCQHCGVGFAREKALASHSRIHGGDSPFECQKCGEMFWDVSKLREHNRIKHGEIVEESYDEDEDNDNDEDEDYSDNEETKYGTFYCPTCGLSFHRQDNLKRHQRVHVKEEFINDHEFGHICNVCGESFAEALDLLAHAEIHARGSDHRCMICGEACGDEQEVAAHVQAKHGKNLPPNSCMLCGRACRDRKTLLKHSWEHSKEKTFACSKCAKTFHNKARLKRHMLSHRNKNVVCDVCGEEFPDGRTLMNHRHSHSSLSGRQFPCRECGKTFGSRSSQQIHIRIHTGERPYGCRFCWKAFADGGTLRKHERIHTGEKPYACAVCPRAFNQRVVLREHIRSHHSGPDPKYTHSVTPYCCSVCSDMFATSQDLIIHLIHHCDLNTAMKRLPQVGPRKYKRRRKLKPHELEMISSREDGDEEEDEEMMAEEEEEEQQQHQPPPSRSRSRYHHRHPGDDDDDFLLHHQQQQEEEELPEKKATPTSTTSKRKRRSSAKASPPKGNTDAYTDFYNSCTSAIENINSIVANSKAAKSAAGGGLGSSSGAVGGAGKKKQVKASSEAVPSRPKMIHTQKARVPVQQGEDGKVRHKTKTLVTRTQPTELKSATGERIRPRTKNVSYHILTSSDKLPIATFPDDTEEAVNNLLQTEGATSSEPPDNNGVLMEQASQHSIDTGPVPTNIIKITSSTRAVRNRSGGRNLMAPGSKLVRLVKGGMIIAKSGGNNSNNNNSRHEEEPEPENILPDNGGGIQVKQEMIEASPLHELAELSMQHAQNMFKCEMCSAVFSDRAKLLDHVPIHI